MTLPKLRSLFPASHDDGLSMRGTFELVSGGDLELRQGGRTKVGQRMTLKPCPQILHRIAVRRIRPKGLTQCSARVRVRVCSPRAYEGTAALTGRIDKCFGSYAEDVLCLLLRLKNEKA